MESEKRKNSSRSLLLYLAAAFFVGLIAGALGLEIFTARDPGVPEVYPTPTLVLFVHVVISAQEIPCGAQIEPRMISIVPYPLEMAPTTTFDNIEDVLGKYLNVDVPHEMPILSGMLVDSPNALPDYCKPE